MGRKRAADSPTTFAGGMNASSGSSLLLSSASSPNLQIPSVSANADFTFQSAPKVPKNRISKLKAVDGIRFIRAITPEVFTRQDSDINCVAATHNLRWVITGGGDGVLRRYDFFNSLNGKQTIEGNPYGITKGAVALSSYEPSFPSSYDQNLPSPIHSVAVHSEAVWVVSGDKEGRIGLRTVRKDEGKLHHQFEGHQGAVTAIRLYSDEQQMCTCGADGRVMLWDLNTGQRIACLTGHTKAVTCVSIHPRMNTIATGSMDGTAKIWDARSSPQRVFSTITGAIPLHTQADVTNAKFGSTNCKVTALSWLSAHGNASTANDSPALYIGRTNGMVEEWDINKNQVYRIFSGTNSLRTSDSVTNRYGDCVCAIQPTPNQRQLLVGYSASVRVWNLDGNLNEPHESVTVNSHSGLVSSILVDPLMEFMVTASGRRGNLFWPASDNSMLFHSIQTEH